MYINDNGFVNLMEAVMGQAYKDAESTDKALASEANAYIEKMQKSFS